MTEWFSLAGKTALIIGATRGIGLAMLLAAPGGAFISGQNLIVDGGTTIGDCN
ncbi:hypothetical protein [Pseudomonas putida]|uniref:hypothetical protein n=1 Tax=Pseudomonas putida TaxID=303 RepID=UPI003D34D9AD